MAAHEGGPADIKKADGSEFFGSFVNTLDTETLDQLLTMSDRGFSGVKRRIYHYPDDLKFLRLVIDAQLDELMARQPAHAAGIKLQRMIKRTRRYLFVFVTNRDLPATNNGSERALRPCAVFRKITNGFRTQWGAELYADIRSIVETGRRRCP